MDIPATVREIKAELRLAMNGAASACMRGSGMDYGLKFGVELPRLRGIGGRNLNCVSKEMNYNIKTEYG